MSLRTLVLILCGCGLFLLGNTTRADERKDGRKDERRKHEALHRAIRELREAKRHLGREKRDEQVVKAHRALERAMKYVRETRGVGGERRKRLVERLERLDRQLKRNHTRARKVLEEAIEDLEYAAKH